MIISDARPSSETRHPQPLGLEEAPALGVLDGGPSNGAVFLCPRFHSQLLAILHGALQELKGFCNLNLSHDSRSLYSKLVMKGRGNFALVVRCPRLDVAACRGDPTDRTIAQSSSLDTRLWLECLLLRAFQNLHRLALSENTHLFPAAGAGELLRQGRLLQHAIML